MVEQKSTYIYNIPIRTLNIKFVLSYDSKFGVVRFYGAILFGVYLVLNFFNLFRNMLVCVCVWLVMCECVVCV